MLATLLLGTALVPSAPALKDRPAANPLQGRWVATTMYLRGKADPQWSGLEYEFTKAGQWIIYRNAQEDSLGPRSYVSDPQAKLPTIDLTENGQTYPGVYRVGPDGDTLTLSFNCGNGANRPVGIEPGNTAMVITFERLKEK